MSFLVRKIEYSKWRQRNILEGEPASADAITGCMRTRGNKLSLWSIDNEVELEAAVLAIAAQSEHLDTIDVLCIDLSLIQDKGLRLEPSAGLTPYTAFKEKHTDIIDLDYKLLGVMAEVIIESIRRDQRKQFTRSDLKKIITSAVEAGKVNWNDLERDVQDRIPNPAPTEDGPSRT